MTTDLFGAPLPEPLSEIEQKRAARRKAERPKGYAAPPGSGPADETCGSCAHHYAREFGKRYHKCALTKATKGPGSDIRVRSPACSRWQAQSPTPKRQA